MQKFPAWAKWVISIGLIALTALSWTRYLDDAAQSVTLDLFKRALAVAALARGFNGVISVAQGTEVAIQPVGIGVTLTIGEILDPLNDLIERFSALALVASVSLGLQLTLGQILSSPWFSGALSIVVLLYLVQMWRAPSKQMSSATRKPAHHFIGTRWISKALGAFIFLRFLLAVMLLATHFVDQAFLVSKQDEAIAKLSTASSNIESLQAQAETSVNAEEDTFLDRTANQISNFLDASSQTLDLKAQLEALEAQIEDSVEEIINLIVIFLLQTLLLPVAGLWLCWWALQAFWRYPANTQR